MVDEVKVIEADIKADTAAVAAVPDKVAGKIDAPVTEALTSADGWIHTHPNLAAAAVLGIFVVVAAMIIKLL